MTYKEAYDKVLPEHKRKEEKYNILVTFFLRPLSILMTLPFIGTRIKPTTITKISLLFSIIGFGLIGFGRLMLLKLLGWGAILIWVLLDCVDGNLARCTNQCSSLGDLWDTTGGYAAMVCIFMGAGIGAFYDDCLLSFCDNYWWIICGSAAAIFSLFPRLVMHKKKSSEGNTDAVKAVSDKRNFGLANIIAMNLVSPTGFMDLFLLISIIFHLLNFFVLGYVIINFGVMVLSLYKLLKE